MGGQDPFSSCSITFWGSTWGTLVNCMHHSVGIILLTCKKKKNPMIQSGSLPLYNLVSDSDPLPQSFVGLS